MRKKPLSGLCFFPNRGITTGAKWKCQGNYHAQVFNTVSTVEPASNDTIKQCAFMHVFRKEWLKMFLEEAWKATIAEMIQFHDRKVFQPVTKSTVTKQESLVLFY
jgi:hypothetical protein